MIFPYSYEVHSPLFSKYYLCLSCSRRSKTHRLKIGAGLEYHKLGRFGNIGFVPGRYSKRLTLEVFEKYDYYLRNQ